MSRLVNGAKTAWGFNRPRGPVDRKTARQADRGPVAAANRWSRTEATAAYDRLIDYIRHENELLNHRTSWFLAIQAVLGTGAGFIAFTSGREVMSSIAAWNLNPNGLVAHALMMWLLLAAVGVVTSAAARRSTDAALYAQDSIDLLWKRYAPDDVQERFPDMMGGKGNFLSEYGGSFAMDLPTMSLDLWRGAAVLPIAALFIKIIVVVVCKYWLGFGT